MGYMHIENLYKNQTILGFKRCFALEKVHGTSAVVAYQADQMLRFSAGGAKHGEFVALFDQGELTARFVALGHTEVVVYGEAYGGKMQGMRATYGDELRFIVFDVRIGETWLSVPDMADVAEKLGLEVVPYVEVSTDLAELDRVRDEPSIVAMRRGCGDDKRREGVVLRPLVEMTRNNGQRVIAKHKCDAFSERATPQKVVDITKLKVLEAADSIAQEWVTPMRLTHVLDKIEAPLDIGLMRQVIVSMMEDVYREADGEVVESREANSAIGRRTAELFKDRLKARLVEQSA